MIDVVRGQESAQGGAPDATAASRPLNVVIGLEGLALGGCPINALDLGRALRERGHRVNVFAIDEDVKVSLIPYAEQSGFDVTLVPRDVGVARRSWHIRRFAEKHSADVVHVFAPWLASSAAASVASRRPRVSVVTNLMMSNVSYTPRYMPLIVGTRLMQDEAQEFHPSNVHLIEPPVDVSRELAGTELAAQFRLAHGVEPEDIMAAIVSRVDSHMKAEGIRHSIRAVGDLDIPHLRLVIVGDGDAFEEIRDEADRVNAELRRRAVVMAGVRHDPRPAYAAADIVLGMGGSALRSLAHRKPLIVLGERGFSRVFEPSSVDYFLRFGFYGDQPDDQPVDSIAEHLRGLLDAERRRELSRFGHDLVRERFGLEASAETLERIYRMELECAPGCAKRTLAASRTLTRSIIHQVVHVMRQRRGDSGALSS